MSFFSVRSLSAGYGDKPILRDVSFDLDSGRMLGILGANGSGKTTLLRVICGSLPHRGECRLEGVRLENLSPRYLARLCGYIPQKSGISIDISALDVVLMGFNPRLGLLEYPNDEMKRRARRALEQVGLGGREDENYLHLSEGQKQLCILARTLASDSRLLLLDEPESALDFRCRHRMLEIIRKWMDEGGRSAIVTLHDPMLALNHCDRLLLIDGGGVLGMIRPGTDSLREMEAALERIYGSLSLHRCADRQGQERIVMIKERECT